MDSQTDSPLKVLNHFRNTASLPWIGRPFSCEGDVDPYSLCKSVKPDYIENSGGYYIVSCEFADRKNDSQNGKETQLTPSGKVSDNPLEWNPEIEISPGSYSAPVDAAYFLQANNAAGGNSFLKKGSYLAITNSSLEPQDPSIEEEYGYKIVRFTTNIAEYDDEFFNQYNDTINDADVTIEEKGLKFRMDIGKHYGKITVGASLNFTNGILYWRRTIELHVRGWNRPILDQGTRQLYTAADATKPDGTTLSASDFPTGRVSMEFPIVDEDGMPIDKPRLLDGNGKQLKEGKPPVLLVWRTKEESDFSKIDWV